VWVWVVVCGCLCPPPAPPPPPPPPNAIVLGPGGSTIIAPGCLFFLQLLFDAKAD
jgi:hypothetical protein